MYIELTAGNIRPVCATLEGLIVVGNDVSMIVATAHATGLYHCVAVIMDFTTSDKKT